VVTKERRYARSPPRFSVTVGLRLEPEVLYGSTAPWRGVASPPGQELLGVITSHGPTRESYTPAQKASGGTAKAPPATAATAALSAQRVQAEARQRYCSEHCRKEARKWRRWKAQQRYRKTAAGQAKRKGQSRRYRERVQSRKPPEPEVVNEAARVIPQEYFFRAHVRPAGVLRGIRAPAAKPLATLLFARVPAGAGASHRAGTTVETGAHLNPDILIPS
jgi:hypothetical protein